MVATAQPTAVAVFGAERPVDTLTADTVALASVMAHSLADNSRAGHMHSCLRPHGASRFDVRWPAGCRQMNNSIAWIGDADGGS